MKSVFGGRLGTTTSAKLEGYKQAIAEGSDGEEGNDCHLCCCAAVRRRAIHGIRQARSRRASRVTINKIPWILQAENSFVFLASLFHCEILSQTQCFQIRGTPSLALSSLCPLLQQGIALRLCLKYKLSALSSSSSSLCFLYAKTRESNSPFPTPPLSPQRPGGTTHLGPLRCRRLKEGRGPSQRR